MIKRLDNRACDKMRPVKITKGFLNHNPHSVFIEVGNTKVLCVATLQKDVPPFKKYSGEGWVTAEYNMLPGASSERIRRERSKIGGRTQEIQRLIGRSIRSIFDLSKLKENTILLDADVIQADGGTRTASITGCFIALKSLVNQMILDKTISEDPISEYIAAISIGVVENNIMLDLAYEEDSKADVDMNIVMTESGKIIEIQGTAEKSPFSQQDLLSMIAISQNGIMELIKKGKEIISKV